jgi:hypothetical protein
MFLSLEIAFQYVFGHIGAALFRIVTIGYYRPNRVDPSESIICTWFGFFGTVFMGATLKEIVFS